MEITPLLFNIKSLHFLSFQNGMHKVNMYLLYLYIKKIIPVYVSIQKMTNGNIMMTEEKNKLIDI